MLTGVVLALVAPWAYTWYKAPLMEPSLAGIMLAMGLSLTAADFEAVLKLPYQLLVGTTRVLGSTESLATLRLALVLEVSQLGVLAELGG